MPQIVTRLRRPTPNGSPRLVVPLVFATAFAALAFLVGSNWSMLVAFDRERVVALNHLDSHSAAYLELMRIVSVVASTAGWSILLGVVAGWLITHRRWRMAAFVVSAGVGSPILNAGLKKLVHRPRPVLVHPVAHAGGWSFPSGHTQAATVGCAVLLVVFLPALTRIGSRWAVAGAAVVVALVALSRMSLGVHYPTDIAGSILCGVAWVRFLSEVVLRHRTG